MELIKKYQGYIAIGLAAVGLVALVMLSSNNDVADTSKTANDKDSAKADAEKAEADRQAAANAQLYNYTAQVGDSYSVLARKAVQAYNTNEKANLTQAQVIAAETQLTVDAGSIELNEGQTVAIQKSAVKAAVDSAMKLDADTLAAWEAYVPSVDFDTSAAGQAATK